MKISIEIGDRDACLRPQYEEDDTFVSLLWVLVIIGMIPVAIITLLLPIYTTINTPLVFVVLFFIDFAISAHLTWKCRQDYIKEHGESA